MNNSKIPALLKQELDMDWNDVLDRSATFFINDRFTKYAVLRDGRVVCIDKKNKRHFAHFRFEDLFNGRIQIQYSK